MSELINVLDENGIETGEVVDRKDIHSKGLWHKTAHVWIINDKNEVLLQRRSADKDINPNKLDVSVGGHVTDGDTSVGGAIRETGEEVGLKVTEDELIFLASFKDEFTYKENYFVKHIVDVYLLNRNVEISEMAYQKEELSGIEFYSLDKFKELVQSSNSELVPKNHEKIIFPNEEYKNCKNEYEVIIKYLEKK